MAKKMNYRAPVIEEWEPIVQALGCCDKARCEECPYEQGYYECENILETAQDVIRKLVKQKEERIEAVMVTVCKDYCKCKVQEEMDEKCATCPLGKWLEDKKWRH